MSDRASRPTLRARLRAAVLGLAREHASSPRLSAAFGLGVLVGTSPFYGLHVFIGAALGKLLRLNQLAIFLGEQVSLPFIAPFLVFINVQIGYVALHGEWLTLSRTDLTAEVAGRFVRAWLLGWGILGTLMAFAGAGLAYSVLSTIRQRRPPAPGERRWTGRSRGTALGYSIFYHTMRLLGRRGAYALLFLVLPYYFLFARRARRHSDAYLRRVLGERSFWRRQRDIWRHLRAFAHSMVDSALLGMGRDEAFTYTNDGHEHIVDAAQAGHGAILLSAHVGTRAVAGQRLTDVPLNIVVYENEAEGIRRVLGRLKGGGPSLIEVNDGPAASVRIIKALRRGELVAMLADRGRGQTLDIEFLGAMAAFPIGPFMTAVVAGAPVLLTFGYKEGATHQSFHCLPARPQGRVPRGQRQEAIHALATRFAAELERYVLAHPYQWYNFYDFWQGRG